MSVLCITGWDIYVFSHESSETIKNIWFQSVCSVGWLEMGQAKNGQKYSFFWSRPKIVGQPDIFNCFTCFMAENINVPSRHTQKWHWNGLNIKKCHETTKITFNSYCETPCREDSCKSSKGLTGNMNFPVDKFFPLNICNQAEGTMNTESVANESTITWGEEGQHLHFWKFLLQSKAAQRVYKSWTCFSSSHLSIWHIGRTLTKDKETAAIQSQFQVEWNLNQGRKNLTHPFLISTM